ncbi:MAG TPA: NAD(P)-dependent oxidoreductase [Thermoanaerobaculia bacterium]|nr:NAD(P)-dependent oxidoreductase [Thermoanaerobaculia bacterium]
MTRRVLVTGAAGFVAANLARRLVHDGQEAVLVVRPGSDLWRLDGLDVRIASVELSDPAAVSALMREARPEWVFHLAAHGGYSTQRDLSRIVATNVVGSMNVVNAAVAAGAEHVVCAGSSSEYGFKDHAPSEDELVEPNSDYAVTKAAATLYGGYAARRSGARVSTLRLYSVYGAYEEPSRLVPQLLLNAMRGILPPLVAPETARDFVYIDDVVDAFLSVAASSPARKDAVYNVGSGRRSTLREVVEIVREEFGVAAVPAWGGMAQRSWDTAVWTCDNRRIAQDVGWRPATELREGLRAMMEWLRGDTAMHARYLEKSSLPPAS